MSTMSTMSASAHAGRAPKGFTLVELMVVVVIIAILMGLLGAAFMATRTAARITVIKTEINQLETALENYKNEYSAYPPDFAYVSHPDAALRNAAQDDVIRHLHTAFPRYVLPPMDPVAPDDLAWQAFQTNVLTNYGIDVNGFDAASGLLFWLGGLPESFAPGSRWIPAGFHADPAAPFKQGLPRETPLFTGFQPERIAVVETHQAGDRYLRFYPAHVKAPYVYFKSHRVNGRWGYRAYNSGGALVQYAYQHAIVGEPLGNNCVPYCLGPPPIPPQLLEWRNRETFQILSAGIDGEFGNRGVSVLRYSKTGGNFSPNRGDFDNITNFSPRTLEDEIE